MRVGTYLVGLAAGGLLAMAMVAPAQAALSKRQLQAVENEVLPAYYRGHTLGVLDAVSKLTRRMSEDQVAELDASLAEHDLPATGDLLLTARLTLLRQNARQRLPKPGLRELLITLKHIRGELETLLADSAAEPAMAENLPLVPRIEGYEDLLWNLHVLEQRLATAGNLAEYAQRLVDTKRRVRVDTLPDTERDLLETDFDAFHTRLASMGERISEREIELRIRRIEQATALLGDSDDIKDRFFAAWAIDVDGDLLHAMFAARDRNLSDKGKPHRFRTELLNDEALPERIKSLTATGRERAGDLLAKSRLLYTGLHWWLRGRYGKGTDGFGLLKSPAAVKSERAQFALYMPAATPEPTNPLDSSRYAIPEVDRRHHYIWAWEYREVMYASDRKSETIGRSRQATTETQLSRFY